MNDRTGVSNTKHAAEDSQLSDYGKPRLAYRGAAWTFAALLSISLVMLAFSLVALMNTEGRLPQQVEGEETGLVLIVSTVTSVVSLIGLLSTNLLAWRREAREARSAEVQLQRQQLELEKLRLELEKQKQE